MSKKFLSTFFVSMMLLGIMFLPKIIFAQLTTSDLGTEYGTKTELTEQDPRDIVALLINTALGLLGTITLVLIVYAGFLWMTAAGNGDQIDTAKGIMSAGIIGLAIVLSAWALSTFVINSLLEATN